MASARSVVKLAAVLVLAGAAFDSPSLYVPGIALALLWAVSLAWVRLAAGGTRIERERGPATVVEGEQYPLRIRIRRGTVPPRGELADPLLERPLAIHPFLRERVRQISLPVRFERRGRRRLEPARLIVRDPLGLRSREVRSSGGGEVLVLPRIEPVLAAADGGGASGGMPDQLGEGSAGSGLDPRPIDFEIDGLRPYRAGGPASRIHWPAFARTGELLERRLVAGAESAPLVVLDASRPDSEEALDRAVRAAASLCVHVARTGGCALLLPREARAIQIDSALRMWPEAHARLALVESHDGAPALVGASRAESVFWVQARGGERAVRRSGGLAARVAYLITPSPIPGRGAAFTVAGCHGHVLAAGRHRATRARAAV